MQILPLPAFTDNYIWIIVHKDKAVFDCVDPGDALPVLQFAKSKQLKLRAILLTHHHQDHIGGVQELSQAFPSCKVYGPHDTRIPDTQHQVKKGDKVFIEPYTYQVLFNPGHTSSHISYYEAQEAWLFCGDTLFSAGCGRVFDGTMEALYESIQLFKSLPADTKVFCAHEYTRQNLRFAQSVEPHNERIKERLAQLNQNPDLCSLPSTIGLEQEINPFFRSQVPAVIEFALKHGAQNQTSLEVFRILREQKNSFQ